MAYMELFECTSTVAQLDQSFTNIVIVQYTMRITQFTFKVLCTIEGERMYVLLYGVSYAFELYKSVRHKNVPQVYC